MGVVRLSNAGIRDFQKTDSFLAGNTAFDPNAEDFLEEVVLTSSASSITFTGLGSYTDYKHLQIRAVTQDTGLENRSVQMTFNNDSTGSYGWHILIGDGSSVSAQDFNLNNDDMYIARQSGTGEGADAFSAFICDILDFSDTTKNTTIRSFGGTTQNFVGLHSGAYFKTDAITDITIGSRDNFGGQFSVGTRISLYGAK